MKSDDSNYFEEVPDSGRNCMEIQNDVYGSDFLSMEEAGKSPEVDSSYALDNKFNTKLQSGMDIYLTDIHDNKLLSAEEEYILAKRIEEGDKEARDELIGANLRLVVSIARAYSNKGWQFDDLVEEGNIGLINAANNYHANRGTRFSTYASYWIHQAIHRAIINSSKLIRLPAYMVEIISKWRRAIILLEEELHRQPTEEEIARRISLPRKRLKLTLKALVAYKVSLGQDADGAGFDGTIVDEREQNPEEIFLNRSMIEQIKTGVSKLPEREAKVLELRYGLVDGKEYTLRDIGNKLNITRERVRQITIDALANLGNELDD